MSEPWPKAWQESVPLAPDGRNALLHALSQPAPSSIRINPHKAAMAVNASPVPWHRQGYYLGSRPRYTSDPAFHAGAYYPQEASSMSLAHFINHLGLAESPLRVLDMCAAPGGKSTLLRSMLHPDSLLVANEVVGSRVNLLEENLVKWGVPGYAITQSDASKFGRLHDFFDLVLVDAPCSGEGMFRKDPKAVDHWSPANVAACTVRQSRILDEVWPSLRPGGILMYSTCTYNTAENEHQVAAFRQKTGAEAVEAGLPFDGVQPAPGAGTTAFRFFPHLVRGEGFFVAVLRKPGNGFRAEPKARPLPALQVPDILHGLTCTADARGNIFAARPSHMEALGALAKATNLLVPGHPVGTSIKGKFKPGHGMALMANRPHTEEAIDLDLEEALRYLQRGDVYRDGLGNGRVVVQFENFALGHAKSGAGRLVSLYPKHWRVRQGKAEAYTKVVRALENFH